MKEFKARFFSEFESSPISFDQSIPVAKPTQDTSRCFCKFSQIPRPRMACTIPLASFSFQQRSSSLLCHLAMVKSLINDTHILVKMGKLSDSRSFFSPTPRN